jgi:hypothetical protein
MSKRTVTSVAFAGACAYAVAIPAFAQTPADDGSPKEASEQRAQSFEAVQGAVKEDVPGGPLLVMGYGILWVALLLYLIRIVRLQQRTQNDLTRLERALARDSGNK